MEFVSLDTWTLIFTWVNLFILFLIMKKLLFKPVMKMLAERENEVSSMYEKAESAQQNAQMLEGEYAQKLSEAKEEAARIMARANAEIELEKKRALDDMKQEMIAIASMMAQKVVSASIDTEVQESLIDETLKEMGENTWLS